jgi:hypothetical protein
MLYNSTTKVQYLKQQAKKMPLWQGHFYKHRIANITWLLKF